MESEMRMRLTTTTTTANFYYMDTKYLKAMNKYLKESSFDKGMVALAPPCAIYRHRSLFKSLHFSKNILFFVWCWVGGGPPNVAFLFNLEIEAIRINLENKYYAFKLCVCV
jgi:hypothetical protein